MTAPPATLSGSREQGEAVHGAAWPSWVMTFTHFSKYLFFTYCVPERNETVFLRHPAQHLECPRNGLLF